MAQRRYCAFISYRHADNVREGRRWAEWLHRALERYVVPPDLVGQPNLRGEPIRRSLYPIFRDEDELPANADLASGIRAALEASDYMIVLCSPRSAVSPWVRKEVREFKELGRSDWILAVMVAGEPNADDPAKARDGVMRDEECFCEELRFSSVGADGAIDWSTRTEPIAADLRPAGTRAEGFVTAEAYREYLTQNSSHAPERIAALTEAYRQRLDQGLLKVIAGLLGVALGTLVDRDAAHRADLARKELARSEAEAARLRTFNRRLAVASMIAVILASLAGFFWWRSSREAAAARAANQLAAAAAEKAINAEQKSTLYAAEATMTAGRLRVTLSATDQQIGHLLGEHGKYVEALVHEARALSQAEDPANARAISDSLAFLENHARLPIAVLAHAGSVNSVAAFNSDGTQIVTVGEDKTARVWDLSTSKPIGEPLRHAADVNSAAFSPDGTRVVTTSQDHTVRVWDAATGKLLGEPMWHVAEVNSAAFNPDGTRVVTVAEDKTARVWDASTGIPLGEAMRHDEAIMSTAFSPDGARLVTTSRDNTARVWNAATGKPIGQPMRHDFWVCSASFSSDGNRVVTASLDNTARVWDAATGKPLGEPMRHDDAVWSAAFSPDGTRVVTGCWDHMARVWDTATGKQLGEPMQHDEAVLFAAFSPDGTRLVTASLDSTARVWDAATGEKLGEPMRHEAGVRSAAFSRDGMRVLSASDEDFARVWDVATGKPLDEPMWHEDAVLSAAFSPDGTRVVTASRDKTARVWDAATGEPLGEPMRHEKEVNSAAFSPDGTHVVTASRDNTARVWDATTGKMIGGSMRHDEDVLSAAFSPDGTRVITTCVDYKVRIWRAATGEPIGKLMLGDKSLKSAAFSFDGKRVVTTSSDNTAQVWDASTGRPLGEPMRHRRDVTSAVFSPDGTRVVTASEDKTARVWDVTTGKPFGEPMRHEDAVDSAAFSPDGTWVVTAGRDKTARVWNAATGKAVGEPMRHNGIVHSAAFSPNGARVVTASDDHRALVWDVAVPMGTQHSRDWLSQLDELAVDAHFGAGGAIEPLGERWQACHDSLERFVGAPTPKDFAVANLTGWFLADPRHRTISPLSSETTEKWLRRRDDEFRWDSLQSAFEVDPTDVLCLTRRGRRFAIGRSVDLYWADLYSKLALKLAVLGSEAAAEAIWRRAVVLALSGKPAEAAALADHAPAPLDGNGWGWEAKWEAYLLLHRDADAAAARKVADGLAAKMWWFNKKSYSQRVKEAEAAAQPPAATQPAR